MQSAEGVTPKQFGQWEVAGWLGGGESGDVYEVRSATDQKAVVKVFRKDRQVRSRERYEREIGFLETHTDYPGILPFLDAHLEEDRDDGAIWYVVPQATPLDRADAKHVAPYDVIKSIALIATTLADLALQGIHHRNLKPGNLFLLEGKPVVGDFALFVQDSAIDLTKEQDADVYSRPGEDQDPEKADVYALAISLQALLDENVHDINGIDALLGEALKTDPKQRMNMARFSGELSAIFEHAEISVYPESIPELDAATTRLGGLLASHTSDASRRAELTRQAKLTYGALVASTVGVARTSLSELRGLRIDESSLPEEEIRLPQKRAHLIHSGADMITATVPGAMLVVEVHAGFWDSIDSELLKVSVQREWGEANLSMTIKWLETDHQTEIWKHGWQQTLRASRSARSFNELSRQTSLHLAQAYQLISNWVERRELPELS